MAGVPANATEKLDRRVKSGHEGKGIALCLQPAASVHPPHEGGEKVATGSDRHAYCLLPGVRTQAILLFPSPRVSGERA
jgi:hypothetical protein